MRRNIDQYLDFDSNRVRQAIENSDNIRQFWNNLSLPPLRKGRGLELFNAKFGNIAELIDQDKKHREQIKHDEMFSRIRVCEHPNCNNTFTWNERPHKRFCSDFCAHSFVGMNRSEETRRKIGISVSEPHQHVCPRCGKHFIHIGTAPNTLCAECKTSNKRDPRKFVLRETSSRRMVAVECCKYCGAVKGHCKRPEICKRYQLFPKMIKLFHMDRDVFGTERIYDEYDRISNQIYDLYWNQQLSIQQIKELVGYKSTAGSFSHFLSKFIKFRNSHQALSIAYQSGRVKLQPFYNIRFKTGFHETWNGKRFFFRSSYEEDYCKELDTAHIDYEIETLTIPYYDSQMDKVRTAFPDFYLPESNLIVEVKSDYTLDVQNMVDRFTEFKRLGYNVELLLEHKHYPDMSFFTQKNLSNK